jgi:Ni,Fe-hydrogenase III small subunit
VVVSGPITMQSVDRLIRTLAQVPEPKCVVSLGSCPRSGNVFKGSFAIAGPLERYTHVDVSVGGCTPKPEAIVAGLAKAAEILEEKRRAMRKHGGMAPAPAMAAAVEQEEQSALRAGETTAMQQGAEQEADA